MMSFDKQHDRSGGNSGATENRSYRSHLFELTALAAAILILISPLIYLLRDSYSIGTETQAELHFVGSPRCGECHHKDPRYPGCEIWCGWCSHH